MRIIVTGCGGFLGSEVVRQLIDRGDEVIGISRSAYPNLVDAGMVHRRGDLSDAAFVNQAFQLPNGKPIDAVVHTAAVAGVWGSASFYERNNVSSTQNVIAGCKSASIPKLVFTSSPSVTFDGDDQVNIDESVGYPNRWLCHYPRTKAMAEQAVLEADQTGGLRTVALRPHLIWGQQDPHLLPRVVQRARSGRLRIVGDGTNLVDTVHVVNAAAAHLDAIDALSKQPDLAAGRSYFISQDDPVNCWDWISQICELAGVTPPRRQISFQAAYRLGHVLELTYKAIGRQSEPPMTRFVAAQLAKHHYFDISAARERLGFRVRVSMEEGMGRLRESGCLKAVS